MNLRNNYLIGFVFWLTGAAAFAAPAAEGELSAEEVLEHWEAARDELKSGEVEVMKIDRMSEKRMAYCKKESEEHDIPTLWIKPVSKKKQWRHLFDGKKEKWIRIPPPEGFSKGFGGLISMFDGDWSYVYHLNNEEVSVREKGGYWHGVPLIGKILYFAPFAGRMNTAFEDAELKDSRRLDSGEYVLSFRDPERQKEPDAPAKDGLIEVTFNPAKNFLITKTVKYLYQETATAYGEPPALNRTTWTMNYRKDEASGLWLPEEVIWRIESTVDEDRWYENVMTIQSFQANIDVSDTKFYPSGLPKVTVRDHRDIPGVPPAPRNIHTYPAKGELPDLQTLSELLTDDDKMKRYRQSLE